MPGDSGKGVGLVRWRENQRELKRAALASQDRVPSNVPEQNDKPMRKRKKGPAPITTATRLEKASRGSSGDCLSKEEGPTPSRLTAVEGRPGDDKEAGTVDSPAAAATPPPPKKTITSRRSGGHGVPKAKRLSEGDWVWIPRETTGMPATPRRNAAGGSEDLTSEEEEMREKEQSSHGDDATPLAKLQGSGSDLAGELGENGRPTTLLRENSKGNGDLENRASQLGIATRSSALRRGSETLTEKSQLGTATRSSELERGNETLREKATRRPPNDEDAAHGGPSLGPTSRSLGAQVAGLADRLGVGVGRRTVSRAMREDHSGPLSGSEEEPMTKKSRSESAEEEVRGAVATTAMFLKEKLRQAKER